VEIETWTGSGLWQIKFESSEKIAPQLPTLSRFDTFWLANIELKKERL
jgi:hypothetical protein